MRSLRAIACASLGALALIAFSSVPAAHAQRGVELTPFAGWMWGGTLDYASGSIHVNAAPSYGGMLGVEVRPSEFVEISYWYQGADVIARPFGLPDFKFMELATHYIQAGGTKYMRPLGSAKVVPFATGGLGMTIFSPSNGPAGVNLDDETVFSISVGGGLRYEVNEKVALRLQSRLLLPTQLWGAGVWFGTGGGGVSVSGTSIAQGDATLGIVIKLGQ
jgi:Outer membrane protein beta-barrel domain